MPRCLIESFSVPSWLNLNSLQENFSNINMTSQRSCLLIPADYSWNSLQHKFLPVEKLLIIEPSLKSLAERCHLRDWPNVSQKLMEIVAIDFHFVTIVLLQPKSFRIFFGKICQRVCLCCLTTNRRWNINRLPTNSKSNLFILMPAYPCPKKIDVPSKVKRFVV